MGNVIVSAFLTPRVPYQERLAIRQDLQRQRQELEIQHQKKMLLTEIAPLQTVIEEISHTVDQLVAAPVFSDAEKEKVGCWLCALC